MRRLFHCGKSHRGVVLVLVLWLVVLLFVVAVSLSYEMHLGGRMTSFAKKRLQALALARSGVAQAVTDLKNDRLMAAADPLYNNDTPVDIWAQNEDKTDVEQAGGMYTVRVFDEDSKIDLNTINPANKTALVYLLEKVNGLDEDAAQEITNSFIDYIDPDTTVIDLPDQDEEEYYTDLMLKNLKKGDEVQTFKPKNEGLLNVDELMNVPGFTWKILYGDPEDTPTDPIARADMKEMSTALIDYATIRTSGRVNINTAPLPVVEAMVFAASGNTEPESIAKTIDKFRQDLMKISKGGSRGIMDPDQLNQSGVDPGILQNMNSMFRVGQASYFFTIISRGTFEGVRKTLKMRCYIEVHGYPLNPENKMRRPLRDERASGYLKSNPDFKIEPEVRVDQVSEL